MSPRKELSWYQKVCQNFEYFEYLMNYYRFNAVGSFKLGTCDNRDNPYKAYNKGTISIESSMVYQIVKNLIYFIWETVFIWGNLSNVKFFLRAQYPLQTRRNDEHVKLGKIYLKHDDNRGTSQSCNVSWPAPLLNKLETYKSMPAIK